VDEPEDFLYHANCAHALPSSMSLWRSQDNHGSSSEFDFEYSRRSRYMKSPETNAGFSLVDTIRGGLSSSAFRGPDTQIFFCAIPPFPPTAFRPSQHSRRLRGALPLSAVCFLRFVPRGLHTLGTRGNTALWSICSPTSYHPVFVQDRRTTTARISRANVTVRAF